MSGKPSPLPILPGPAQDLRNLQTGTQTFAGVTFEVQNAAIVLQGVKTRNQLPPAVGPVPVGFTAKRLFFHAGVAWAGPNGKTAGSAIVSYADGQHVEKPFIIGEDLNEWWVSKFPVSQGKFGWSGMSAQGGQTIQLYVTEWVNPHPEKVIKELTFKSSGEASVLGVVGVTAEVP